MSQSQNSTSPLFWPGAITVISHISRSTYSPPSNSSKTPDFNRLEVLFWRTLNRSPYLFIPSPKLEAFKSVKTISWIINIVIMLGLTQVAKNLPFDDSQVLMGIRGLYLLSNLIITGIYLYLRMKINYNKGQLSTAKPCS